MNAPLSFALIINGDDAPTPAPRCAVADCATGAGVYHVASGRILRPDYETFRAALPSRLRRYVTREREPFPSLWFDKRARFEHGRTAPALPYFTIRNARGDYVATVYAALVEGEA
jgi:hypothetical protein